MKNVSDSIGNRTRDLSACSAVPQPTAPPHTPPDISRMIELRRMRWAGHVARVVEEIIWKTFA